MQRSRCHGLIRVNVYKDAIKAQPSLPALPNARQLAAALAPAHAALREAAPLAVERPVHVLTPDEEAAGAWPCVECCLRAVCVLLCFLQAACVLSSPGALGLTAAPRRPCLQPTQTARGFLEVVYAHLSSLCGDLRLHTIVNVGMAKRTGVFMRDSLLDATPPRDRPFVRAFTETQMFAAYADGVIADDCDQV
jgi:hypothetical protein